MSIHIHQYIVRFDVSEKNRHIQFLVGKNKYNQLIGKMEKTLKSPLTARRSNQLILKGINPGYSFEGLMLKLQYFGYLTQAKS